MIYNSNHATISPHHLFAAEWRASGKTVEAENANEACRKAAASLLDLSLPEVDRMFEKGELEVVAVIKGDPQFEQTRRLPLFPGF